jgi:cell division septation protein DedD
MEQRSKGAKSFSNLLSKTAGLVFFSFLAISLGVVFGLLFEGWVKDQPGTPVGTDDTLQTVDLSTDKSDLDTGAVSATDNINIVDETAVNKPVDPVLSKKPGDLTLNKKPMNAAITNPVVNVKYKVRVGPYSSHNEALAASQQLHSLGYPVYVGNKPPFAVQVGAFATQANADRLKAELTSKGYKVTVNQN